MITYHEDDIGRKLARDAFYGTSHFHERRGDGQIQSYLAHMAEVEQEFSQWATDDNRVEMNCIKSKIKNISEGGVRLVILPTSETPSSLQVGDTVILSVGDSTYHDTTDCPDCHHPSTADPADLNLLPLQARVVWHMNQQYGLQFTDLKNAEQHFIKTLVDHYYENLEHLKKQQQ